MSCSIRRIASFGSSRIRNFAISTDSPDDRPAAGSSSSRTFGSLGKPQHDLELALLAVRQVADLDVLAVEEGGLLQQPMGLVVDVAIGRQEPPHHELRRPQAFDRQQHVVEHGEPREQAGDLKGARHAQRGAAMARPGRDVLRRTAAPVPSSTGKIPVIRLNSVVLPAPFGPMMALRSPGMIWKRDVAHGVQAAEALGQALAVRGPAVPASVRVVVAHAQCPSAVESGPGLGCASPGCARPVSCRTCRAGSRGCRPASSGTRPC